MNEFWDFFFSWPGQQVGVLFYLCMVLAITLSNAIGLRRLRQYPDPVRQPRVALLIPARNEERTITKCVTSLLEQDYPNYAIWVLDDNSTDRTPEILAELVANNPSLHILQGQPLPDNWLGKPWACQQLADVAEGELLLFVDSDTWHSPSMVSDAVSALEAEQADLLSVIPDEVMVTFPEKLSVPIIPWSLFTHFPLALAQRFNWSVSASAIGQMMLFRRSSYDAIGGHGAVRQNVAEDMALAQRMAAAGYHWRLLIGYEDIHCRMYRAWPEVLQGFGKNLFAVFGRNIVLYLFIWLWLGIVFIGPWVVFLLSAFVNTPFSIPFAVAAVILAVIIWAITVWRLHLPFELIPLYPLSMAFSFLLAFHSLGQKLTGQATWKSRRLRT